MSDTSVLDDLQHREEQTDFSKVVQILLNSDFKRLKTILNNRQVTALTTMDTLGKLHDVQWLIEWIDTYIEYRVSGDGGKGRNDIVEISKFHYDRESKLQNEMLGMMKR